MARGKKHTPEQIVSLLRQIEVAVANGKTTGLACKEATITEQTYYRWRKEFGGLQVDQARRLKNLEKGNSRLKWAVAEGNVWFAPLAKAERTKPITSKLRTATLRRQACMGAVWDFGALCLPTIGAVARKAAKQ